MQRPIGVLVMAYGSPSSASDLESYYTHIRGGSTPSPAMLESLRLRYSSIGNISPLWDITYSQAQLLEQRLNERFAFGKFKTFVGFKHIAPFIEDAVAEMRSEGIEQAVAIVLSPYIADYGPKPYMQRVRDACKPFGAPRISEVCDWWQQPRFISHWASAVRHELAALTTRARQETAVIFSAHSLPVEFHAADAYAQRVTESARSIAKAAGVTHWAVAWQSAGQRRGTWLGPDIASVTQEWWSSGSRNFIYCPVGFVSDHLEVLYDLDRECRDFVVSLGGRYIRAAMPNTQYSFIACLADAVEDAFPEGVLTELEMQR